MLVDCQACPVRVTHCADCMVTALTRIPIPALRPVGPEDEVPRALDPAERRAVSILVAAGLVDRREAERASVVVERGRGGPRRAAG